MPLVVMVWDASFMVWATDLSLCALSIWSIPEAERRLGEPDHGQIVIDEWVGMWLAAYGVSSFTNLTVWIGL